jgi:hypothetical protein
MQTLKMIRVDDIMAPVVVTGNCAAEWANGTLPRGVGWQCDVTGSSDFTLTNEEVNDDVGMVLFWLEPRAVEEGATARAEVAGVGVVREELSYSLHIIRDGRNGDGG